MALAASQFALDGAEDAALLAGDEDAVRILRIVTAVSLVDIATFDLAASTLLGILDDVTRGVTVIGIAGQRPWRAARTDRPGRGHGGVCC